MTGVTAIACYSNVECYYIAAPSLLIARFGLRNITVLTMVQRAMPSAAHHSEISALCSRDLADSARQQIDKEIEDLYGSVRRLKSRRNMFAPGKHFCCIWSSTFFSSCSTSFSSTTRGAIQDIHLFRRHRANWPTSRIHACLSEHRV